VEDRRGGKWKIEKKGERKFVKGIREQRKGKVYGREYGRRQEKKEERVNNVEERS
jgi:hypothetical protein